MDTHLLEKLCSIHAPCGDERPLRDFILEYVEAHSNSWKVQPKLFYGDGFQDCLILVFGKPRVAAFCHMDSHGFTVRYEDQLVPIGGPEAESGMRLSGRDSLGDIDCELVVDKNDHLRYSFGRAIDTGTSLVYKSDFRETNEYVQCCYLDNRLGVYTMLQVAESMENGAPCLLLLGRARRGICTLPDPFPS